ncbi:MAG: hypothetical protein ABIO70_17310 [Pseudomonadota bacterium]
MPPLPLLTALLLPRLAGAHVPHDIVTAAAPPPGLQYGATWWLVADHEEVSDLYRSDDGGRTWQATHGDCLVDRLSAAVTLDDGATVLLGDARTWWSDGAGGWVPRELGFAPVGVAGGAWLWLGDGEGVWTQAADGTVSATGLEEPVASLHAAADGGVVALLEDGSVAWREGEGWRIEGAPPGTLSATADAAGPFVGTATGAVWRWEEEGWAPCGESPYLRANPRHEEVVALATDGGALALAHADIGPAISRDRCATWEGLAAPLEIRWPEDEYDDGYQCWTTTEEAFTALYVAGDDAFVAGYDGPATLREGVWSHPPLKGPDYARGIAFSRDFARDGAAVAAVYGCGTARTTDAGATWTCAAEGLVLPAIQDADTPPDAEGLVPVYAVADRLPVRSEDEGRSWSELDGPWRKVWALTAGEGARLWATNVHTDDGTLPVAATLLSEDGGVSWSEVAGLAPLADEVLVGVVEQGDLVVGWTGTHTTASSSIARSTDDGASFAVDHEVSTGVSDLALWPPREPTRVLAVGPGGVEIRTEDGWTRGTLPEEVGLRRVACASDGTLVAATWTQRLLVSADGGDTWADLGAQLEGQIEDLATHPDFARHPVVLASGPAGSFQVDEQGVVIRWMGLQRVDDDTEWVVCDPACTEETWEGAGLGEVRRVPAGTRVEAWLRGTSVRVIGAAEGSASLDLWVDDRPAGTVTISALGFPGAIATIEGLDPGLHLVRFEVTAGDGVILDALEATDSSAPLPWDPEEDEGEPEGCGCGAAPGPRGWLVPLLAWGAIARRRARGPRRR